MSSGLAMVRCEGRRVDELRESRDLIVRVRVAKLKCDANFVSRIEGMTKVDAYAWKQLLSGGFPVSADHAFWMFIMGIPEYLIPSYHFTDFFRHREVGLEILIINENV